MNFKKIVTIFSIICILCPVLIACGEPVRETISVVEGWTPGDVENSESIVVTPGGPSYAGNTAGAGTKPLDSVKITQATLTVGTTHAYISYRETMESFRSATHPNIINVFLAGKTINHSTPSNPISNITLYTVGAPKYMSIACVMQWTGGLSSSEVLMFQTSEKMSTGKHTFDLGIIVDGVDFGTVPCTVDVINTGAHPAH